MKIIVIASHEVAWQSINNQFRHIEFVLCSFEELDYFANARNDVKTIVIASHEVAWQSINNQFSHIEFVLCLFKGTGLLR